jgi:hypothetical protein
MSAYEYLKQGAVVPVTMDAIRALVELGKHQAEYIAQLEKGLESSIEMNKVQAERFAELERKHKEEFDYVEKLLKERAK